MRFPPSLHRLETLLWALLLVLFAGFAALVAGTVVAMLLLFGLTVWRAAPWRGRAVP